MSTKSNYPIRRRSTKIVQEEKTYEQNTSHIHLFKMDMQLENFDYLKFHLRKLAFLMLQLAIYVSEFFSFDLKIAN